METKTCGQCGKVKELGEFYFRKDINKFSCTCNKCNGIRREKWRENNPDKARASIKKWREKNKEKILASKKKWNKKNIDKVIAEKAKSIAKLSDGYVASALGIRIQYLSTELIELKRQQILIHRSTKQLIQTINEKQDER